MSVLVMALMLAPGSASAQVGGLAGGAPGFAAAALPSAPVRPPGPPMLWGVSHGNQSATVSFSPPLNQYAPVLNYQYSIDDGVTWKARTPASIMSPIVITGLTNGRTYRVRLRAVTVAGAGAPSVAVTAAPWGVPGAPTALTPTAGNQTASVRFAPPASNGGRAISNYQYSLDNGVTWKARSPASIVSPIVITGLTNGRTYQVKLRAVNSAGAGAASVVVTVTPRTVPGAPTGVAATAGDQSASLRFVPPASNGGAAITNYQYSLDSGVTWRVRLPASAASPIVITGLTNGRTYQVKLRAVNSAGPGAASVSVAVVPRAVMPSGLVTSPGE